MAKTKRAAKAERGEAEIERDLVAARKREHALVESCSNDRPESLRRAWLAADTVNELLRERADWRERTGWYSQK